MEKAATFILGKARPFFCNTVLKLKHVAEKSYDPTIKQFASSLYDLLADGVQKASEKVVKIQE